MLIEMNYYSHFRILSACAVSFNIADRRTFVDLLIVFQPQIYEFTPHLHNRL